MLHFGYFTNLRISYVSCGFSQHEINQKRVKIQKRNKNAI